jgi:hypothetical protein
MSTTVRTRARQQVLERLRVLERRADSHAKELDIQLRRIAELQAQLDELTALVRTFLAQTSAPSGRLEVTPKGRTQRPRTLDATLASLRTERARR